MGSLWNAGGDWLAGGVFHLVKEPGCVSSAGLRRLLRRVTGSLAGRLPTQLERAAVAEKGLSGLPPLLDKLMKEDAFYDRLREGFNDIFLTLGVDGNPEATVLSYEHFTRTRLMPCGATSSGASLRQSLTRMMLTGIRQGRFALRLSISEAPGA